MLAGVVSVMQAVADILAFPTQPCSSACALQCTPNLVRRPITGCEDVIFNAGYKKDARVADETYHGRWDDAMSPWKVAQSRRVRCGDDCMKEVIAFLGHQAAKRIDQALMLTFPIRLPYMAMQAYFSKRILLAGEMVSDSFQPHMAFL